MEKEYQILSYIQQQEDATQRAIAKETGIGLGHVNLLLKRLAKKGYVKIERLSAKSLRYMLTPQGLKEKTRRTYQYIKSSYSLISRVTLTVNELARTAQDQGISTIYLYGPQDEVYEIAKLALQPQKGLQYSQISDGALPAGTPDALVLVWRTEEEERLTSAHRAVNILEELA